MMINKRLIGTVKESKKYIAGNVIFQWISQGANIAMMGAIAHLLQSLYDGGASGRADFADRYHSINGSCYTIHLRYGLQPDGVSQL
ncbi:MAG: hypothetical protein VB100_05870 [Angelakisella sp.]|nr:hypothetical protein [Angelakisella sp.]